jgi:hypothetical protein
MNIEPASSPSLSELHLKQLRQGSGISDSVIAARGYRTVTNEKDLTPLGFAPRQRRTPGLLIPIFTTDGSNGLYCFRPDAPRVHQDRRARGDDGEFKQHVIKYEIPAGSGVRVDCPLGCRPALKDPDVALWITEGVKKADAMASRGLCAIDLNGVWGFKGKNEFAGTTWLADWDHIALKGRNVRIVYDSDVMQKAEVRKAQERLIEHLQRKGAHVAAVYLPGGRDSKTGVDDYLLSHSIQDLEALVDAPRPRPQAARPTVELLDDAPLAMRRPLAVVGDLAYAGIWPHVKTTTTESTDRNGNIVNHNPPLETQGRRLCVIRSDGAIFGDGGNEISDLGFDVFLAEVPPDDRLWSSRGVKAFLKGERREPADVFREVADVIDRFMDFDRSLADQRTMAEMVALYIMATWFLDAFNVIGFIWSNGERGSGKTQLLSLVAELGYLGQLILAGGSYASLRDLADYGATLCFDDAEDLSDPKRTDPDKRTLLLAGNRRGNTVPVKEPATDRTWRTRYVNTFCPRGFSATRLPDEILASRSIIVPLIRTPDRRRGNADPLEYSLWPHDRRRLIDSLWAMAITHLPELSQYEKQTNQTANLVGRALEPWRALLSVAAWLQDRGVKDLFTRMEALSRDYQRERRQLEGADLTALVIRAICECAGCDVVTLSDVSDVNSETFVDGKIFILTRDITAAARGIAETDELDLDLEKIESRRIGRTLGKLRIQKADESGTHRKGWKISRRELAGFIRSFGLAPTAEKDTEVDVTNVTQGHNVTDLFDSEEGGCPMSPV